MCDSKKIDLTSRDYADFIKLLDSEPNADLKRVVRGYIDSCRQYRLAKTWLLVEDLITALDAWRDQAIRCSGELPEPAKKAGALIARIQVHLAELLEEDMDRSQGIKDSK